MDAEKNMNPVITDEDTSALQILADVAEAQTKLPVSEECKRKCKDEKQPTDKQMKTAKDDERRTFGSNRRLISILKPLQPSGDERLSFESHRRPISILRQPSGSNMQSKYMPPSILRPVSSPAVSIEDRSSEVVEKKK